MTVQELIRAAGKRGWDQSLLCALPATEASLAEGAAAEDEVGGIDAAQVYALRFPNSACPFELPGMSDVMPYPSSVFSALDGSQIAAYEQSWGQAVQTAVERFQPDVIHVHHLWLLGSIVSSLADRPPVVLHGHGTDLRQLELCPGLASRVLDGVRRAEALAALHGDHAETYAELLDWDAGFDGEVGRVCVVGAGFREDVFHAKGRPDPIDLPPRVLYAGKISCAKGVDCLLEAASLVSQRIRGFQLELAGGYSGEEGEHLAACMAKLEPDVRYLGPLSPEDLAAKMRGARSFVLPSLFEGLPLVLIEALACGCRAISTRLPGVEHQIASRIADGLTLIDLPELDGPDRVRPEAREAFVNRLADAMEESLRNEVVAESDESLDLFRWDAVFDRVEVLWNSVITENDK